MLEHLGFVITPHQMRHIAAKLILDRNPGVFETVRQLLGRAAIKSTVSFYAGFDTSRAVRHHDKLIQKNQSTASAAAWAQGNETEDR